jgi:hypothetical protein
MQPSADIATRARVLLTEHGDVRSQPGSDWRGSVPLPAKLADFYERVGPINITIESYGNAYFLPSLGKLWDFQAGYRWNGLTGEPIHDWHDEWIVVADKGGDPFIFNRTSSTVLFAYHGQGVWKPEEWFSDLPTMAACLAEFGSAFQAAGDNFTDADSYVRPECRERAIRKITEIVGSRSQAEAIVDGAGWG